MQHDIEEEGIAIVGMAAQLPAGTSLPTDLDYESFWTLLVNGMQAYEPLKNIFDSAYESTVPLPSQGAFLKNATSFDNIAFGISTKDARVMPYSARRLFDLSFQALQDSGINSRGQSIGCFMSGNGSFHGQNTMDAEGSFAWTAHAMANRISYAFDLTGPSLHLDTACSSSLTALHLAISAIEKGDCTAALVGAAQINRDLVEWKTYVQGGILGREGICKPLSSGSDGFGRGEGAVVIVIKSLKAARRDNDHIYSVILGSAINSTGSRMPVNVPNGIAQQYCIKEAYRRSGLNPRDADYIELHATGTSVGDPIEANAHFALFQNAEQGAIPLPFGTVKGNIGHLEVAAFLAALAKACLIFEHNVIPPTVNFSPPEIAWNNFQAVIPVTPIALGCRSSSQRAIISISASGIGGAGGHVVLQQAPPSSVENDVPSSTAPVLFLVGGLSSSAVDQISQTVRQLATDDPNSLRECAVTLSRRARQLPWRTYFTIPHLSGSSIPPATVVSKDHSPLAFVFSGQGPQHLEMGRQAVTQYPVFKNTILQLDEVYRRIKGVSLVESTGLFTILGFPAAQTLPDAAWPVTTTVSAIAMVQIAMFDLLKSVGIVPNMMLGHSAGETAALYASGAGPKEMAMEIAIARGDAMTCTESADVGMAILACDSSQASDFLAQVISEKGGVAELSCFNTPDSVAISGTATLLDAAVVLCQSKGFFAQRLRTMVPGHSSFMDSIKGDYMAKMENIFSRYPGPHVPQIPVFSTCQARPVEAFTPRYFWDNCRNAVRFSDAISHCLASSTSRPIFLELSCHPVLSSYITAHEVPDTHVLCPMRRMPRSNTSNESQPFLDTLGRLSLLGVNSLDLTGFHGFSAFKSKLIDHPLIARLIPSTKSHVPRLLANGPLSCSSLRINKSSHPDLAQHVINGEPIFPATAYIELLLESGANFLWDIDFMEILSLAPATPIEINLQRLNHAWSITTRMGSCEREHVRGFLDKYDTSEPPRVIFADVWERLPSLDFTMFYHHLEPLASYGPQFQRVVRCHGGPSEAIAEIEGPTPNEMAAGYSLHPAILDACLHIMLHPNISRQYSTDVIFLPSKLEHFIFYRRKYGTGSWYSHIHLRRWTPDARYYDIVVADRFGLVLCEFRSLVVRRFTSAPPPSVGRSFDLIFQPVAVNVSISDISCFFPKRADELEIQLLFRVLDSLAVEMLSNSLNEELVIGEDESRRRYLTFARQAVEDSKALSVAPESLQYLSRKWPCHFEITARIASIHPSVFNTARLAVDALYSDDLMSKFYSKGNQTSNVCAEATRAFSAILDTLRKSGKRTVRVLEVGAGTGLLTHHLIDELEENPDLLVEYTVTDISYALVASLAGNISCPSIIPKAYDIGRSPESQGFNLEFYDVVVSLHVLHTAPDVKECLRSLLTLLVPGGCFLTVELDGSSWRNKPGSVWFDCIFGSFAEWFGYNDGRPHCVLAPLLWKEHLEASDFINVQTSVQCGAIGREFCLAAQKPHTLDNRTTESWIDTRHLYRFEFGKEEELQAQLRRHDQSIAMTIYVLAMIGRDADAARGLCVTLRRELPRWDIRLPIFESSVDISDPVPVLSRQEATFSSGENEVFFDRAKVAHVLRVVHCTMGPQTKKHAMDPNYITVRVSEVAGISTSYTTFVGLVEESHHSAFRAGDFICGVAKTKSDDLLRVHVDNIIPVVNNSGAGLARKVLARIVISLINPPLPSTGARMAITVQDHELADLLHECAGEIAGIHLVFPDLKNPSLSERLDILLSDSSSYAQYPYLHRWVPRGGEFLLWDELLEEKIGQDPLCIRQMLDVISKAELHDIRAPACLKFPVSHYAEAEDVFCASPPFRGDAAYVLLGGIGGLGIDLAVWMYQHGARHLVLTSRRGISSLDPIRDALALAKVTYLKSQKILDIRLERSDATDAVEIKSLLRGIPMRIAGCFHMVLALSDAPFFTQTSDTFRAQHESKFLVLENFAAEVAIESLDFFVAFSSVTGLFGMTGQSNYASACTALEGALERYPNAFSLITPGVSDAGYLERSSSGDISRRSGLASMSADDLWCALEDGLRKLDAGPFNRYIPDLNWDFLHSNFVLPMTCSHLLSSKYQSGSPIQPPLHDCEAILCRVLELLEVSAENFDATQPLTVYGLDSLTAAKLAPFLPISQMQLLSGVTWAEVEVRIRQSIAASADSFDGRPSAAKILLDILDVLPSDFDANMPLSSYGLDSLGATRLAAALRPYIAVTQMQLMGHRTWAELSQLDDPSARERSLDLAGIPLVEICDGSGIPLIIIPGGNGLVTAFFGLRKHVHGAIWALQVTEATPFESLTALLAFWKQQICAKRPRGPYRFAAYSSTTIFGVALTKLLEEAGEEVLQLVFLDHSPMLWTLERAELVLREQTVEEFRRLLDESVLTLARNDPSVEDRMVLDLQAAFQDNPDASAVSRTEVDTAWAIARLLFDFLGQFYLGENPKSRSTFIPAFESWLLSIKAPMTVIVAEHGPVCCVPGVWSDLGADRMLAKACYVSGVGHFGLLRNERVAQILEL
ncbi:hypothetical protein K438DRAFT_2017705 [Mycena galopus ATCC 62051]|nr:hypothetical protein K438DRAFT_2017705 [Mycena galopus ATCC 62051]